MDADYRAEQMKIATEEAEKARAAYFGARRGSRKEREAAEELEFWTNKKAFLSHAR